MKKKVIYDGFLEKKKKLQQNGRTEFQLHFNLMQKLVRKKNKCEVFTS